MFNMIILIKLGKIKLRKVFYYIPFCITGMSCLNLFYMKKFRIELSW